ncbi:unnamed protein product [Clonostachys rhizophaga]|uniref:Uncharacterized protein n=1 Tax=Clonostachys rhizophaga TaxID=160324 RepID=A0A9N9VT53_9HYPO|nr:unnamed protein product [Clonostachys rhizophaga]
MLNFRTRVWLDVFRNAPTRPARNAKLELAWEAFGDPLFPTEYAEYVANRENIDQMASLKATLLCIAFGFATTSAAPVAQEFEPPGKECWSNADCYRAYFCSFPFEGKPGTCTYG